jgi:SH3 domain protein
MYVRYWTLLFVPECTSSTKALCFLFFLFALAPLLWEPPGAVAETWYVTPNAEVAMRTGQGTEYRILAAVPEGTKVTLLEEEGTWARVRLSSGKEGWMPKRFLSTSPPLKDIVAGLRSERERLVQRNSDLSTRVDSLEQEQSKLGRELDACLTAREQLQGDYETLRADAADVLNVKQALSGTVQELQETKQQLATTRQENEHLRDNERIKWFLAGGAVLVAGWIIGLVMGRGRRRRPSLL